jgi:hypothetical protein
MATNRVQFFSTLEELVTIIRNLVTDMNLSVFLYHGGSNRAIKQIAHISIQELNDFNASRLYLAEPSVDINQIDPNDISAAQIGLIQVNLPYISGQTLFMAEIAVKTDWVDSATGNRLVNDQLMSLFKRMKPYLLKDMMAPVLGENIVTGGKTEYSTIKFTRAAKAFNENGGELMQPGVNNVRFIISHA